MPTRAPTLEPERSKIDADAIAGDCYASTATALSQAIAHVFDVAVDEGPTLSESDQGRMIYAALLAASHLHVEFEEHVVRALEVQADVDDELRRRREAEG